MGGLIAIVSVVMIFSIPIVGIVTDHLRKQTKLKHQMIKDQLELEKLKHENYLLETEKLRLELQKIAIDDEKDGKLLP